MDLSAPPAPPTPPVLPAALPAQPVLPAALPAQPVLPAALPAQPVLAAPPTAPTCSSFAASSTMSASAEPLLLARDVARDSLALGVKFAALEAKVTAACEMIQVLYDERDGVKALIQDMIAEQHLNLDPAPAQTPPITLDPPDWNEDVPEPPAPAPALPPAQQTVSDDEDDISCGVCHVVCRKLIIVLVPCGHFPYCKQCVQNLQQQAQDRGQGTKLVCPYCQMPCTSTCPLKALHPYRDHVADV